MGTRQILVVNIHNLLFNSLFVVLEKIFCFLAVVLVEAPASSMSVVLLRSFILFGCDCRIWRFLLHLRSFQCHLESVHLEGELEPRPENGRMLCFCWPTKLQVSLTKWIKCSRTLASLAASLRKSQQLLQVILPTADLCIMAFGKPSNNGRQQVMAGPRQFVLVFPLSTSAVRQGTSNQRRGLHLQPSQVLKRVMNIFGFVMNANSLCRLLLSAYFSEREIVLSTRFMLDPLEADSTLLG